MANDLDKGAVQHLDSASDRLDKGAVEYVAEEEEGGIFTVIAMHYNRLMRA